MVEVNKIGIFLSIVLLSLFVLSTANAADLSITVKTIDGVAEAGDVLTYAVTFYNLEAVPVELSTNMLAFTETTFSPSNVFTIPAKSSYTINLSIKVSQNEAAAYGTAEGKTTYQQMLIFDKDGAQLGYNVLVPVKIIYKNAPAVWSAVKYSNVQIVPAEINPKNTFSITFTINNPVKAATVDAALVSGELQFSVPPKLAIPNGTNEISINDLKIPDTARPGQYGMSLRLVFLDATLDIPITLTVGSFGTCTVKEDVTSGVLGKVYTATLSVDGNVEQTCLVSTKLFGIERNLVVEKSDNYVYSDKEISWQMNVQPGSSVQVGYTLSYLPIIAVPFVIILLAGAWWYFTRKVEVEKELVDFRRHPGFMDLKIQLKVKNLTNGNLTNVRLIEPLPAFAKEIKDFGTVPGTLTVHNKGKAVKWELDHLKSKEERIFSYRIRTSVEVIGRMSFPPAVMKYTTANGESLEETSNILAVEVE
jgi:hypothetical protein